MGWIRGSALLLLLAAGGPLACPPTTALAADPFLIPDIIVTAQRREERAQTVPISVATLSGEKLHSLSAGAADLRFLNARIPSLTAESSFGRTFPRFYIRGLGNTDFDINSSQPVSLVYDDIVLENPLLKGFPAFDLDRIEVARGPQGTLFGRNTPAGTISFISRRPKSTADGYAHVALGRFGLVDTEAAMGGPLLGTRLSARLSVLHQQQDGLIDNGFTGVADDLEDFAETAGRLQLLYQDRGPLSLHVSASLRRLDGTARVFHANAIRPGGGLQPGFDRFQVLHDGGNGQELDQQGLSGRIEYALETVTLTAITGYQHASFFSRGDIDGGVAGLGPGTVPFSSETADRVDGIDQFSQELRVASNRTDGMGWQAGLYWFDDRVGFTAFSLGRAGDPLNPSRAGVSRQDNRTAALFGQGSLDLGSDSRLTGGLRFTWDEKEFRNRVTVFDPDPAALLSPDRARAILSVREGAAETEESRLSWDLSATTGAGPDTTLYARIANGFRAPSIQGRTLFGGGITTAGSEEVLSLEAGVKAQLLEGRARLNLAAFHYTVDNPQFTAVGGMANSNVLLNADRGVGWGGEMELEAIPVDGLVLTLGASINHTEIQDKGLSVVACGSSCTVLDPTRTVAGPAGPLLLAEIDGNPFPQAPRWIANATLRYGLPLGPQAELFVYTDWAYRSAVNFFLYESAEYRDERLLEGGLRLGYTRTDGRFEVSAFVRNITDHLGLESGVDFNNLTGMMTDPRRWGAELRLRF